MSVWHGADHGFLAVSSQMTLVINPVLGCCYLMQLGTGADDGTGTRNRKCAMIAIMQEH